MEAVYADLQRMAENHMRRHFGAGMQGVTVEPAAIVNETYLKLIKQRKTYDNRGQFFAIATKIMLRVLMDYHRARQAAARAGRHLRLPLDGTIAAPGSERPPDTATAHLPRLVSALEALARLDSRTADVVKLRVVWGLTMPEVAEALGVSLATVERDWSFARAWLARESARD